MNLQTAIDSIWECTQRGIHYSPEWKGQFSLDDAYRIQLGVLARHLKAGRKHIGWKIGLTSKAMQEQQKAREPVFGFFLESAARRSGTVFDFENLIQPAFENELCLTLGEPLHGPNVSPEQAQAAIRSAAPALEIPERRGAFGVELAMDIADDIQAKHFVSGPESGLLPEGTDLAATTVEVYVNGERVDAAAGTAVMGSPANSLAWLANKLSEFGMHLDPGLRIMSGSFTKQYPIAKGDHVLSRFKPFGTVEAQFR